jgi:hypothetical protein
MLEKINFKKSIFVSVLAIIIAFASFFMITESARYYNHFYDAGAWQPLYLAALLEMFVLVLAVIRIGKSKMFLLMQKLIMIGVFCAIIFAAGMQAVNPTLESLAQVTKQEQLGEVLKKEYDTLIEDRAIFDKQKQKTRTAISTMERKKIVEDMKKLFDQDVKTDTGRVALINILLLFGIRFLVQISNIFCASMLGVYFRFGMKSQKEIKQGEETAKEKVLKIHPMARCKFRKLHGKFIIFNDDIMTKGIGGGITPPKAWADAYRRMRENI